MGEIDKALREASAPGFWGSIEISYKAGKPSYVKLTKTTQLENLQKKGYPTNDRYQTR